MDYNFRETFPARSAVFHISKGLIFNRKIAYRVQQLFPDKNGRTLPIKNMRRLKKRLFSLIQGQYKRRLEHDEYSFTDKYKKRMRIGKKKEDKFSVYRFSISKSEFGDDDDDFGGIYNVYPTTFICKKCGDLQILKTRDLANFNPLQCERHPKCDGRYEQLSILLFCETCGRIDSLYFGGHSNHSIQMERGSKDAIRTWTVKCRTCGMKSIDFMRFTCKHRGIRNSEKISNADSKKFKILTVREGAINIPRVETCVDIPSMEHVKLDDIENILIALYLNRFSDIFEPEYMNLQEIESCYSEYNNPRSKRKFLRRNKAKNWSEDQKEENWRNDCCVNQIELIIKEIREDLDGVGEPLLSNFNDYLSLTSEVLGNIKQQEYSDFINTFEEDTDQLQDQYEQIRKQRKISSIKFIPEVHLITSCYGLIKGVNKFYKGDFVPHFEPIWKKSWDPEEGFAAYSYPYVTEGIIIELDRQEVIEWLYKNGFLDSASVSGDLETWFLRLKEENKVAQQAVETLLHTLSHLLIRSSSVYTGIDMQSLSEMIFPGSCAIFIYSTSSINTGGLQFVFENELEGWFAHVDDDIRDCPLDPSCLEDEEGSCYACLYVPEFVCHNFNYNLDRDVFIGRVRYGEGFW